MKKRFILPIVFVLVGFGLLVQLRLVDDYMGPRTWGTGLFGCDNPQTDSSAPCTQGTYKYDGEWLLWVSTRVGGAVGVLLIPSGVAIGIYRLARKPK